jgi:hypothetical protein
MAIGNIIYSTSSTTIESGSEIRASNFERSTNLQVDDTSGNLNISGGINTSGTSNLGSIENIKIVGGNESPLNIVTTPTYRATDGSSTNPGSEVIPAGKGLFATPVYIEAGTYTDFTRYYDSPVVITGTINIVGNFRIRSSSYIDFSKATLTGSGTGEIMLVANGYNPDYPGSSTRNLDNNVGSMAINVGEINFLNGTVKLLALPTNTNKYTSIVVSDGQIYPFFGGVTIRCSTLYFASQGIVASTTVTGQTTTTTYLSFVPYAQASTLYIQSFTGSTPTWSGVNGSYTSLASSVDLLQLRMPSQPTEISITDADMKNLQNITWGTIDTSGSKNLQWKQVGYKSTPITLPNDASTLTRIVVPLGVKKIIITGTGMQILRISWGLNTSGQDAATLSGYTWVTAGIQTAGSTISGVSSTSEPVIGNGTSTSFSIELYQYSAIPNGWIMRSTSSGPTIMYHTVAHKKLDGPLRGIFLSHNSPASTGTTNIINITYK